MAQSPTISIPRKKTDEVDWTNPIRAIIRQSYGENPDTYSAECAALQRCRQDAVRGAGSDITARDLLYKYFGQLELLELRFSEIKVSFPWSDAFTSKLTTQTSLAFEKASIIFQIASTHSFIASTQNRSDPEGLKRAFHYFRTSAGMLTYINDNFLHAPSTDLSREVVKLLVGIMLAQASEVFFEKLVDEKKSSAFVAKVASQAAYMYNGLTEEVKEFFGKGIFDRNWVTLLQIKAKYFAAVTQYYRYLADSSAGNHSDAISRVTLSETLAKDAYKMASTFGPYFLSSTSPTIPADGGTAIVDITKALMALTSEKKATAQRDNDLIYNAIPTTEATLPPVDKLAVANPIPIQEVYGSPDVQKVIGPDIFIKLIPLSVHKSASIYSEEKAKLARAEVEKSDAADLDLSAALNSLGLPSGLQKWKDLVAANGDGSLGSPSEVPRDVEQWAAEIENSGGISSVEKLRAQLENLKRGVGDDLNSAHRELEIESKECEAMRVKYEHLWTQEPSATFSRPLRQDLKAHTDSFAAAGSSDAQIDALWSSIQPDLSLLLSGPTDLEQFFAEQERISQTQGGPPQASLLDFSTDDDVAGSSAITEITAHVAEIDETLGRLNKIMRERHEVLKDLKEKIQTDDVSHLLLLQHRSPNEQQPTLFASELEKFRPYQSRIATTISHQESALEEVSQLWKVLSKNTQGREWVKKAEGKGRRREELIARFSRARDGWTHAVDGLGKGTAFYRDLGELTKKLLSDVKDFVRKRNSERDALISDVEAKRRLAALPAPVPEKPRLPPPPSHYDLSSSLSSLNLSPATPSLWQSQPTSRPSFDSVLNPARSPQILPPPVHHQARLSTNLPTPVSSYSSQPGLPPPPPPRQQYSSPPPLSDPYSNLFGTPGLSSHFSVDSSSSSSPPPPPQPFYSQTSSPPPAPGQYQQFTTSLPAQPPYYHQTTHQQPQYGATPAPALPPPPPGSFSQPPPPPPWNSSQYGSGSQRYGR